MPLVHRRAATTGPAAEAAAPAGAATGHVTPIQRLWRRELEHYPASAERYFQLAIVVIAAVVLSYEFYVQAAVTPSILQHFGMTFPFFVYTIVVGNLVGAFASLIAGLGDRFGRANMVAYGLGVTGLVTLFGLPYAPNLWVYATMYCVLGFVEGIILVATPALVRDFSRQRRTGLPYCRRGSQLWKGQQWRTWWEAGRRLRSPWRYGASRSSSSGSPRRSASRP